jgi:hypothetical protein
MTVTRCLNSIILSCQSSLRNERTVLGVVYSRNERFYFPFSIYCIPLLHGVRDDSIPSVPILCLNPLWCPQTRFSGVGEFRKRAGGSRSEYVYPHKIIRRTLYVFDIRAL